MRIIGGTLKGRLIRLPSHYSARPTTDLAREALFNILDNEYEFEGLKILDLFAGTGAISYEFASRGASKIYCVDISRENAKFIKREAARLGLSAITVVHHNVFDFLKICKESFDLVFADPPYELAGIESLPDKVLGADILYEGHYFILEHGKEHSFKEHPKFVKEHIYGRVHFSFFEG